MYRNNRNLEGKAYETEHILQVVTDMLSSFIRYYSSFSPNSNKLTERYEQAISEFEKDQLRYKELFDLDTLDSYSYDPNSFKADLRRKCPIIHGALFSQAKAMEKYKKDFKLTPGARMLGVTTNIVQFGHDFIEGFDWQEYILTDSPTKLGVSELDEESYTAYGVIGGGIRSHFLYNLYPQAFPNRGQNAIWAFFFLVNRQDYGFASGSEFLMIEPDGTGTHQNYYYPYDLFSFYALQLMKKLEEESKDQGYNLLDQYRYVYLNTFLDHITAIHREDINCLKPPHDELYY
jgi:hypothetical protein